MSISFFFLVPTLNTRGCKRAITTNPGALLFSLGEEKRKKRAWSLVGYGDMHKPKPNHPRGATFLLNWGGGEDNWTWKARKQLLNVWYLCDICKCLAQTCRQVEWFIQMQWNVQKTDTERARWNSYKQGGVIVYADPSLFIKVALPCLHTH